MLAAAQIDLEDSDWSAVVDRQVNGKWGYYMLHDGIKRAGRGDFTTYDAALKAACADLDAKP